MLRSWPHLLLHAIDGFPESIQMHEHVASEAPFRQWVGRYLPPIVEVNGSLLRRLAQSQDSLPRRDRDAGAVLNWRAIALNGYCRVAVSAMLRSEERRVGKEG